MMSLAEIIIKSIRIFAIETAMKIKAMLAPPAHKPTIATCPGRPQIPAVLAIVIMRVKPASRAIVANPSIVAASAMPGSFMASQIPVMVKFDIIAKQFG